MTINSAMSDDLTEPLDFVMIPQVKGVYIFPKNNILPPL